MVRNKILSYLKCTNFNSHSWNHVHIKDSIVSTSLKLSFVYHLNLSEVFHCTSKHRRLSFNKALLLEIRLIKNICVEENQAQRSDTFCPQVSVKISISSGNLCVLTLIVEGSLVVKLQVQSKSG